MINEGDSMAAELLGVSASGYAAYASNRLLEKVPEAKSQFGDSAFANWKDHFCQRINELSVAMAEKEPSLFLSRVRWSRAAFHAREAPEHLLRESLICLAEVLDEELPEAYRQAPTEYIAAALKSFEETKNETASLDSKDPTSNLAMQYLLQALEGNSRGAIQLVIDAHENGMSLEHTYQVLMTAQREIGRMWHQAETNIAEEHIVTSTTERAMAVLAYKAKKQASNGLTVVSAAVAGNAHDIGVRIVSDFFEFAGWRAVCLGADLPAIEIAQAVKFFDSSLVLLSAALSTQLKALRETVHAIGELDPNCKIIVGGTALQDTPDIWRQLGADAYASTPTEAVLTGSRLIKT
jgi:methanogenic corrinoid protein MtbC1